MVNVECKCKDWPINSGIIDGTLMLARVHGSSTHIKQFIFCPWCGKKLETI
jgi:hypothetical protein